MRDSQHPSAHKTAYWFQREVRLQAENRAAAREDRASHDPDVALLRQERAKRAAMPNPAFDAAVTAYQAMLEAEAKARKGGRRKARSSFVKKPSWDL